VRIRGRFTKPKGIASKTGWGNIDSDYIAMNAGWSVDSALE
jgi:hypothetical protein